MSVSPQSAQLYDKVKSVILPAEWSEFAPDVDAILALKRERNAVILAHNYQTPEIFHGVADIVGDSLALAREAMKVDAEVIVLAGVHFMAETAKLLNPAKRVLIPDLRAGFSHLIAALAAEGTSTVYGVSLINRGYEDFEAKLAGLGAHVERT